MGALLLVRHGQASFGAEDYDVLSDVGSAQAGRLGSALAAEGIRPSLLVHGSMRRQRDTAQAMGRAAHWQVRTEVDDRWNEFDHLDVVAAHDRQPRGASTRDLDRGAFQELFEQATARWIAAGSGKDAEDGEDGDYAESFTAFVDRVGSALRQVAGSVGSGETAVVVTSGGVIAAACGLLTLIPREPVEIATVWQRLNAVLVNASVTRLIVGGTGVRMLSFNEHTQLTRAEVTYR